MRRDHAHHKKQSQGQHAVGDGLLTLVTGPACAALPQHHTENDQSQQCQCRVLHAMALLVPALQTSQGAHELGQKQVSMQDCVGSEQAQRGRGKVPDGLRSTLFAGELRIQHTEPGRTQIGEHQQRLWPTRLRHQPFPNRHGSDKGLLQRVHCSADGSAHHAESPPGTSWRIMRTVFTPCLCRYST